MNIAIQNCNNILNGTVSLVDGALNIKYAINGTGKSTIAKAIHAAAQHDADALGALKPYRFTNDTDHDPLVTGSESISKVMIFDESYISQYVYQTDELLKNSFEIFVKTPDYDEHIKQIQQLLSDINRTFQDDPDLDELIIAFSQFIDGCGKSKTGLAASSSLVKGFGKGNRLNNIPEGLEAFTPYLRNTQDAGNVKWLKWQADGKKYLELADQCPYCTGSVATTKNSILRITQEYDSKAVEHLNKMLLLFEQLRPYFSDETNVQISAIANNAANMNAQHKNYLYEIKQQIDTMLANLHILKRIGFQSLKDADKIADQLKGYVIDLNLFSHLQSELMTRKIAAINTALEAVIQKAGTLQGEIKKQNKLIHKTIEENSSSINDFLTCAGYEYAVSIEGNSDDSYRMILKPTDYDTEITSAKEHLSYGERNALALALFMFSALKENPDLIILDDPISSFDGNKKFALLNMLFMSDKCLRNRTVLMLTHDFNSVIDVVHTMPQNFNPAPHAAFLCTVNGNLEETPILKNDIQSFRQIAWENMEANIDTLNKLVYLRRLLEVEGEKGLAWQLLSNLFHKRATPEIHDNGSRAMTEEEKQEATAAIKAYIPDFDYDAEYTKTQSREQLLALYNQSSSSYEKLQIYRIVYNENNENPVVKKFVNETFHVENDYIFQLNPRKYNTIPPFIMDACDHDMMVD